MPTLRTVELKTRNTYMYALYLVWHMQTLNCFLRKDAHTGNNPEYYAPTLYAKAMNNRQSQQDRPQK